MNITATSLSELQQLANSLRRDVLRSTDEAGSGHPTSCLSCAEIMATLFFNHLRFDVSQPTRSDNDHFILSKGHAAPILWSVMYRAGALSEPEMLALRQADSRVEGHPTPRSEWVQVATGSLGQGLSAGLGMALNDRMEGRTNRTFVLLGDGEVAEGSCWEAAQLASYHHLDKVCAIVDVNARGQTGPTMLGHDLDTYQRRFEAFGWQAHCVDGHDPKAIEAALEAAAAHHDRPSVILARTTKGAGVPSLEGEQGKHGKPAPEIDDALADLPSDETESPVIIKSPETRPVFPQFRTEKVDLPRSKELFNEPVSPRQAFGDALAAWGQQYESLLVFDGEVSNSTYTAKFAEDHPNRFVPCFIAEQNMVGMALGAAQMGRCPMVATFAAFLTRAFDQIRMAAVSRARLLFTGTHAGIITGKDGPSQMGLEDIAMFRAIPGSTVLQPADGPSTVGLLEAMAEIKGIGYLRLIRPPVDPIYDLDAEFHLGGSHTLRQDPDDAVALLASGATVHTALAAADELAQDGIRARVVDLYSIKPLDEETLQRTCAAVPAGIVIEDHYAEGGLGEAVAKVIPFEPSRWRHMAVRSVPRSGSPEALAEEFQLSSEHVVRLARKLASAS